MKAVEIQNAARGIVSSSLQAAKNTGSWLGKNVQVLGKNLQSGALRAYQLFLVLLGNIQKYSTMAFNYTKTHAITSYNQLKNMVGNNKEMAIGLGVGALVAMAIFGIYSQIRSEK